MRSLREEWGHAKLPPRYDLTLPDMTHFWAYKGMQTRDMAMGRDADTRVDGMRPKVFCDAK